MANQTDISAHGGDLGATLAELREELALERSKNELLLSQLMKSEDALADSDAKGFADVIPAEDRAYWRGQLVENRDSTLGMLNRMRDRLANRGGTPSAQPRPLHNRVMVRPVATGGARPPHLTPEACRAACLRNRAGEIARRDGIPFTMAFALAEREMG